ncbi:hypothetical protein WJ32_08535 [Burkholderia ubonensis]|uniref:Uncharacterized protein n=1 Tax=Burkholderia ubonensis TaxID=101571 RepID=A0A118HLL5_9BURK|nr:hypothetical protein [Burkholderia ubonensis]AOJ62500.1 hypothetical protein WJ32_08535 [Burkholderia ubonensis]KVG56463.1 hypothetical protein WJ33_37200 [Burkholderia ubonensis]
MQNEEFEVPATDEEFRRVVLAEFKAIREKFDAIDTRLSGQDEAIAQNTVLTSDVERDTKAVREFMKDGASAARFFCRLAAAWRFGFKWVALPIGALYAAFYYNVHGRLPGWLMAVAKVLGL